MRLENYPLQIGKHPDTAALRNILAYQGLKAPHTGEPFTEAMLLGIGGGLGMGYILWEFKENGSRIMVLGFRNNWQYPVKFMQSLCNRLNIDLKMEETAGKKKAYQNLINALENQHPAMIWVDLQGLPYMRIPKSLSGQIGHVVGVFGMEEPEQTFLIDDRSLVPFKVSKTDLEIARGRIGSYKNRMMIFQPSQEIDLEKAILAGLQEAAAHLSSKSDSFSLPAIRKWARLMGDEKHKKGWKAVFADGKWLYGNLKSIFLHVQPNWPSGGTLRELYADFLTEAAPVVNLPELTGVAEQYRMISGLWLALGEAALPNKLEAFVKIKQLEKKKLDIQLQKGGEGLFEFEQTKKEIAELQAGFNEFIPLSDSDLDELFEDLKTRLMQIYESEVKANQSLGKILE